MLLLPTLAFAASGPFPVTTQDVGFDDAVRGTVHARLYAPPADQGPYPLVGFLHGWLGQAWMYDDLCEEVASWGFVVASDDTETGVVLDMTAFAADADAMLRWVADGAGGDLAGRVSDDPWTAMGHSMGGGTLGKLVGLEPRIETIVAFMPYQGYPEDYDALAAFPGSALYLDATEDTTAPPPMTQQWFGGFSGARGLNLEIEGAGHQAVTDSPWGEATSMPHDEQHEIVIGLALAFLRAEVLGDEDRWAELVGPEAPEVYAAVVGRSEDPPLWAALDGDTITFAVVGQPGDVATVSVGTDAELTDAVDLENDLPLDDGWAVASTAAPAADGALWLQVDVSGRPTRAIQLRTASATTGPATSTGTTPAPSPTDPPAGCGCGSTGTSFAPWPAVLALAGCRRRRVPPHGPAGSTEQTRARSAPRSPGSWRVRDSTWRAGHRRRR